MIYDVIIIGGGAAGLYAASQLALMTAANKREACASDACGTAEQCGISTCTSHHMMSFRVCVLEKTSHPGNKLLVSGNGQCNLTHGGNIKDFINHYGASGRLIRRTLYSHSNADVLAHFDMLGVKTFERQDGKIFPVSLDANEIRRALVSSAYNAGFEIITNSPVSDIKVNSDGTFTVYVSEDKSAAASHIGSAERHVLKYTARNVIVSCGGKSYSHTGSDGSMFPILEKLDIAITPLAPALVPIHVNAYPYGALSGISLENVSLFIENRKPVIGDILFTHNAISGPLIINNSRYLKPGDTITFSYMSHVSRAALTQRFKAQAQGCKKLLETFIIDICSELGCKLPKRFVDTLIMRTESLLGAELNSVKVSSVSGKALEHIAGFLTKDTFTVNSLGSYNQAMVTKGGVKLDEIELASMESKRYPHLFIVGEALDIDGDTGGYNLQFAFSGAAAAAKAIVCS